LLAGGSTITQAALQVGVTRVTVHQWFKINIFKSHLNGLKKEATKAAVSQVQAATVLAVTTMIDIMKNSTNDTIRLSAAIKILESAKVFYHADFIGSGSVEKLDARDR